MMKRSTQGSALRSGALKFIRGSAEAGAESSPISTWLSPFFYLPNSAPHFLLRLTGKSEKKKEKRALTLFKEQEGPRSNIPISAVYSSPASSLFFFIGKVCVAICRFPRPF